jgi:hypothetical protein
MNVKEIVLTVLQDTRYDLLASREALRSKNYLSMKSFDDPIAVEEAYAFIGIIISHGFVKAKLLDEDVIIK